MPARKKTKKAVKKKAATKKKVAKKVARISAARKKKAVKKSTSKKKLAKKKIAKKSPVKKKIAKKPSSKKKLAKKKVAKKLSSKKKLAKKKAAKKSPVKKKIAQKPSSKKKLAKKKAAKKSPVKKKTTKGNIKKKTMGKVTNIKKSPAEKLKKTVAPVKKKISHGDYMGTQQTEYFKQILQAWKIELMKEVDRTVHHMQDDASNFPDPNDRASQEEEFALELRTRDRERKLIAKINESMTQLDSGDYGYCEICGIEIGAKRLEARPTATLCIDCKTLDEIKEHHLG